MKKYSLRKNQFIVRVLVATVFFATLIAIGVSSLLEADRTKSALENRSLTTIKSLEGTPKFTSEYFQTTEKYFNDQLSFRDTFIQLDGRFKKYILQQNIIDGVYIDNNGEMYEPVPVGSPTPIGVGKRVSEFADYLNTRGINVVFAPAPNKATFYEKRLPFYVNNADYGNDFLDTIIENSNQNTNVLDLRATIQNTSKEHDPYFVTDHHWTIDSVFNSYQGIMEQFQTVTDNYGPPLLRSSYTSFLYTERPFYGSFARRVSLTTSTQIDYIKLLEPKVDKNEYEIKIGEKTYSEFSFQTKLEDPSVFANRYEAYGSDNPEIVITNNTNRKGKNLLVLKDSYANPMLQFLAPHTSKLYALDIRHYDKMSVLEYIDEHDIDDVLIVQNNLGLALNPSASKFL